MTASASAIVDTRVIYRGDKLVQLAKQLDAYFDLMGEL